MNNKVIAQYQYIIEQLVPVAQAPDFDDLFKAMTGDISKPHQFQLKMELNRLKQPSPRPVDLRGRVNGTVEPYEHDDKTHYLDPVGIKVFEREIRHYGSFTVGVFEKANAGENNFRVLHKKEKEEMLAEKNAAVEQIKQQRSKRNLSATAPVVAADEDDLTIVSYNANKIQFQSYAIRSEERMNYSISIEVKFASGETLKATSSDLSVSGCKIKIPQDIEVHPGEFIRLHFRGLEEEFALGLSDGIEYEVVATEFQDMVQFVRMKRTYKENIESFDEFLGNFINGNKRRYKVNMENTEEAVIIKGYEQYYVPRITSLPLFITQNADQFAISSVLTTENNKQTMRYWFNEEQQLALTAVFSQRRIAYLLKNERESILYSFTHSRSGKIHHYAALHEELQKDETLKHLFLGFGATKSSWRVHKLQLLDASYDTAHILLSLPDTAGEEVKQMNRPPSARVQRVIGNTVAIAVLTDITEQKKTKQYQAYKCDTKEANKLKVFGVARREDAQKVEIVAVDYVNLRKETRFLYRTKATIEQPPSGTVLVGATRDFSTKGVQIELSEPCEFEKGSVVLVSFPEMQKLTRKFKLTRLPYEAVAISKNRKIVNVRIHESGDKHSGKKFFQQLIQTNRSKLTAAQETQTIPGMPLAMRNMFVNVCNNMPFYIHRKGIRYMINTIGRGGQNSSLHRLMARFSETDFDYHLQPLIKGNLIESVFANILKSIKRHDAPVVRELLVRVIRSKRDVESAINIEFSEDLSREHSHKAFIETATEEDLFFAYRIYLSRTGRPDIDYIAKELKYVGNYAIHRAKVLEEELWGVIGVGDAIDISEEMLVRYGVSDTDIQIQNQAKRFYFTELAGLDP